MKSGLDAILDDLLNLMVFLDIIFTCVQVLDHGLQGLGGGINRFSQEFTSGSLGGKQPENKNIFSTGTKMFYNNHNQIVNLHRANYMIS